MTLSKKGEIWLQSLTPVAYSIKKGATDLKSKTNPCSVDDDSMSVPRFEIIWL